MLAGKLPTPSLDDGPDDRPSPPRDGATRASSRGTDQQARPRDRGREAPDPERVERLAERAARLERRLEAERDRRRQVVERYERLLAARDAAGAANGRRSDEPHDRGVVAALRALRWRLWRARRRLDPRRP